MHSFTGSFSPDTAYRKLGEWYGPMSQEVKTGQILAPVTGEEEERMKQTGGNLFEIYARNNMDEANFQRAKQLLDNLDSRPQEAYPWEKELNEFYPEKSKVVFEESANKF